MWTIMGWWLSPVLFTDIAVVIVPGDTCLGNNWPSSLKSKKEGDGAGLCLLCQFMHVCLPTRCKDAFGIMAGLFMLSHWKRGRKSVATISFPSPRTCSEIGGSSDKESVVLGLLGCQTLEICTWFTEGDKSLYSRYMAQVTTSPYCFKTKEKLDEP